MQKYIKKYRVLKVFVPVILIISIIILTSAYTKSNSKLSDVNEHWAKMYIEYMTNKGAINGYPDGTFKPDNSVTYAEAIKLVVASYNDNIEYGPIHWASEYVEYAKQAGIVPENMFASNDIDKPISRKEVIYMVYYSLIQDAKKPLTNNDRTELSLPFSDVTAQINKYGIDYIKPIKECYYLGIVIGNDLGLMNPNEEITRAEIATILTRGYAEEYRTYTIADANNFLPINYQEYSRVLAYMPNSFYEAGYDSWAKYVENGTPSIYFNPMEKDCTDVAMATARKKAEQIMSAVLNVSYEMTDEQWSEWKERILLCQDLSGAEVEQYIQYVKDNHIILKGGALFNPCTIGTMYNSKNIGQLGMKGIIQSYLESNPEGVEQISIIGYITGKEIIPNNNTAYIIMFLEEQGNKVFALYNYIYTTKGMIVNEV